MQREEAHIIYEIFGSFGLRLKGARTIALLPNSVRGRLLDIAGRHKVNPLELHEVQSSHNVSWNALDRWLRRGDSLQAIRSHLQLLREHGLREDVFDRLWRRGVTFHDLRRIAEESRRAGVSAAALLPVIARKGFPLPHDHREMDEFVSRLRGALSLYRAQEGLSSRLTLEEYLHFAFVRKVDLRRLNLCLRLPGLDSAQINRFCDVMGRTGMPLSFVLTCIRDLPNLSAEQYGELYAASKQGIPLRELVSYWSKGIQRTQEIVRAHAIRGLVGEAHAEVAYQQVVKHKLSDEMVAFLKQVHDQVQKHPEVISGERRKALYHVGLQDVVRAFRSVPFASARADSDERYSHLSRQVSDYVEFLRTKIDRRSRINAIVLESVSRLPVPNPKLSGDLVAHLAKPDTKELERLQHWLTWRRRSDLYG
jgi:predicted DNA-binding protein YlxM (UPF0122 family)